MTTILGIDPGKHGAWAIVRANYVEGEAFERTTVPLEEGLFAGVA